MADFKDIVQEFNSLVQQYKFVEAVDKFYDANIIPTDNNNEPTKGIENLANLIISRYLFKDGGLKMLCIPGNDLILYPL